MAGEGRAAARLLLLIGVAVGVLLMHTLGHADEAGTGSGQSMAAAAHTAAVQADALKMDHLESAPEAAASQQGGVPRPMPMDSLSVCLAVLLMAVTVIRLRLVWSAGAGAGRLLAGRSCWPRTGQRGPPPPLISLATTRTVVLRN